WVAAEDAARMRDALGIPPPQGMPRELLEPVRDALGDLVSRYARTHGPFRPEDVARRLGLGKAPVLLALERLEEQESVLQREVLPARIEPFKYADLDLLCSAGEVIWRGIDPLGPRDGRIALYLADHYRLLAPPPRKAEGDLVARIREHLRKRGASFFADLQQATGAFPNDLVEATWTLVWAGQA